MRKQLDYARIFGLIVLPIALFAGLMWGVFSLGSSHGQSKVQTKWDKQKAADAAMVAKEKKKIASEEAIHRQNDRKTSNELANLKASYGADIARINGNNALRLRDSNDRAAMYRSQAKAGAAERASLASHAAELDRSLTAGIGLVEEFRATLELRDGQIRGLASQIINDRQLISGSGNTDAADSAVSVQ